MSSRQHLPALVFVLLSVLWGSTWVGIKMGLEGVPPFTASGIRLLLAAALLELYRRALRVPHPGGRGTHLLLVTVGLTLFGLPYGLIYWGQQHVTSGMASVLFASLPIWVAIESHFFVPGERLDAVKLAGTLVGFAGILVIFSDRLGGGQGNELAGMACVVLAAVLSGFGSVIGRRYARRYHPVILNTLPMGYGGIVLLAAARAFERGRPPAWTPTAIGSLVYLTVVGSCVAFVLYFWLLRHLQATTVSLIALATPVTAMLLGWVLLREQVTGRLLGGGILVGVGIVLATRSRALRRAAGEMARPRPPAP